MDDGEIQKWSSIHSKTNQQQNARKLLSSPVDPDISSGAKCVLLDNDGVFVSNTCSFVEKGFLKFFVSVYDQYGLLYQLRSSTSWATQGSFAAISENYGISTRNDRYLSANFSASQDFQNASLKALLKKSATEEYFTDTVVAWNFLSNGAFFLIKSVIGFESNKMMHSLLKIDVSENNYRITLLGNELSNTSSSSQISTVGKSSLKAFAVGEFGGEFLDWYIVNKQLNFNN
jgi:hypothetical protein